MLIEHENQWILPYRDARVIEVRVNHQLTLLCTDGITLEINTEAALTHGSLHAPDASPVTLRPQLQDVAPALKLFNAKILSSVAFKSGALRFVFSTGQHLNLRPHSDCEAWKVTGPGAISLISRAGGGLIISTMS